MEEIAIESMFFYFLKPKFKSGLFFWLLRYLMIYKKTREEFSARLVTLRMTV